MLHSQALPLGSAFAQHARKKSRLSCPCFVQPYLQGTWTAKFVFRAQMVFPHLALPLLILHKQNELKLNKKNCFLLPVQAPSLSKACAHLIWEQDKSFHSYFWRYRWGCRAKCFFKQLVPRTSHFRGDPHQFEQRAEAPFSWEGNCSLPQQMSFSLGAHSKGRCLVFHRHLWTGLPKFSPLLERHVFLHQLGNKKHNMQKGHTAFTPLGSTKELHRE